MGFLAEMLEQVTAKRGERRRVRQLKFDDTYLVFNRLESKAFYLFKKNGLLGGKNLKVEGGLAKEMGNWEKEIEKECNSCLVFFVVL